MYSVLSCIQPQGFLFVSSLLLFMVSRSARSSSCRDSHYSEAREQDFLPTSYSIISHSHILQEPDLALPSPPPHNQPSSLPLPSFSPHSPLILISIHPLIHSLSPYLKPSLPPCIHKTHMRSLQLVSSTVSNKNIPLHSV